MTSKQLVTGHCQVHNKHSHTPSVHRRQGPAPSELQGSAPAQADRSRPPQLAPTPDRDRARAADTSNCRAGGDTVGHKSKQKAGMSLFQQKLAERNELLIDPSQKLGTGDLPLVRTRSRQSVQKMAPRGPTGKGRKGMKCQEGAGGQGLEDRRSDVNGSGYKLAQILEGMEMRKTDCEGDFSSTCG